MPRTRWIVIGFLLVAGIVGGVINARGPFAAHPAISYPQYLADVGAGRVEQVVRWRDRLEVKEGSGLVLVAVPPQADVDADLMQAAWNGGVGFSLETIPDWWLVAYTPWVPLLILVAGALIWIGAVARDRRRDRLTGRLRAQ
jgi:hypothetical protein